MATRSTEPVPISGRVDGDGRLVAADPALERLQVEAGSQVGRTLALPQLAALARAAASLGVALSRNVVAADRDHDLDLFVRAEPLERAGEAGAEILLTIERWVARPMAPPRLALVEAVDDDERRAEERTSLAFELDAALNLIDVSPALAALLGLDRSAALGRPLTSLFRLVEEADGSMPLLGAVATRSAVDGQRAIARDKGGVELRIDADPTLDERGRFAGFHARIRQAPGVEAAGPGAPVFEDSLNEALRSPLARIISAADHIVERGDGPLRSDYANYASDIAAAGRHLLSVIRAMSQSDAAAPRSMDLDLLVREAVGLIQPIADECRIAIAIDPIEPCGAEGEAHAVIQILVNLLGNAVRYSPEGATVAVRFERRARECRITIADQGPGIAPADQRRIFERYERVGSDPDGSGLGLAISRRLARSMGGDIVLESAPGAGARFSLVLPAA